ncbi:hypothetical protein GCM10027278_03390 [Paralcaligenes ginsengisoli]
MHLLGDIDIEFGVDVQRLRGAQFVFQNAYMGIEGKPGEKNATGGHRVNLDQVPEL